jgi:dihydrofolate reductase
MSGTVLLDISVSLDGFVADADDDVERLHRWAIRDLGTERQRFSEELLEVFDSADAGAVVAGRRTYDLASGWAGKPAMAVPYVILSHSVPDEVTSGEWTNFVFVSGGVEAAVATARELAGDRGVYVMGGADIARQCLDAGLLDEVQLHVSPVLLGSGVRLFDHLGGRTELALVATGVESPDTVRLRYRVVR